MIKTLLQFIKRGLLVSAFALFFSNHVQAQVTPVDAYGQLSVSGTNLVDQGGNPIMLQGMSLFWSQWESEFYTYNSVLQMRDEWCTNIIRAAMAVEEGGYLTNASAEENRVRTIVEAAIDLGMYVIIDWHDHNAENHTNQAVDFFARMAQDYGSYPNVIYEVYNEPIYSSWSGDIKPYCEQVIDAIRQHDPDNIIVCGTRQWSQRVDEAAADPITGETNIMYTLHYYAGTHGSELRGWAETAMNNGIALFVTEFGTVNADGGGAVDQNSSNIWFDWLDQHKISHCNWSLCDKAEGSATLTPGTGPNDNFASNLTTAGTFMFNRFTNNCPVYEVAGPPNINRQPANVVVAEGETATLSVGVSGMNLTYQWYKDGQAINNSNSSVLEITNATASDIAEYYVVITNNEGTATSETAIINILSPGPYNGYPFPIPGMIQAEEYDQGGQNDTYYDSSTGNEGGAFRNDDVDIDVVSGSNYTIGWVVDGEWTEYSVDVQATGTYDFEFRVATPQTGRTFQIEFDGVNITGTVNVPNTGDWDAYQTVTVSDIDLTQGEHVMRFVATSDGLNLDYINVIGQAIPDCAGILNGEAYIDACGDCVGGTTGNTTANFDNDNEPDCIDNDDDNDSVSDANDCDPFNANIGAASTWYADNDNDGLGDPSNSTTDCSQPSGYVANNNDNNDDDFDNDGISRGEDCNDQNPGIGLATIYYEDTDFDGIGSGNGQPYCSDPGNGWSLNSGDNCPNDINKTEPGDCGCGLVEGSCDDCDGVPNGDAAIDVCGICTGGTTGITPGSTCEPPTIVQQPTDVETDEGTTASFDVVVEGTGPFTYQWRKDGVNIDGANSSTLTLNNVAFSDAGVYTVVVTNDDGSVTSEEATLAVTVDGQTPYNGAPIQVPGIIEAEEFDLGGQDVSYSDANQLNEGGALRDDWIDIEATTDGSGGYNVGWTADGEWMEYTVEVTQTGYYDFAFRVASDLDAGEFNIEHNGTPVIANITVGNTGGWQAFTTVEQNEVYLTQGTYVWRLNIIDGEFNINYIEVTPVPTDCNGDINGTAYTDACGECVGGLTGVESSDADNDGILDCNDNYPFDADNDGAPTTTDCDDNDPLVGQETVWYADTDNDGIGDAGNTTTSCTQPQGYVLTTGDECPNDGNKTTPGLCGCGVVDEDIDQDGICDSNDNDLDNDGIPSNEDCDDTDPSIGLGTTWYADFDGDGVGDVNSTTTACTQPVNYVATSGDNCPNDVNKTEAGLCGCGNVDEDIDQDGICDADDNDLDNDGVPSNEDCDDNNPNIGAETTWYADFDGDGLGDPSNTRVRCNQPNRYVAVAGDECPNDGNKTTPGLCGCGNVDVDVDNDGVCDLNDDDLDNDGITANEDCDDNDPNVGLGTTWYADADNDGLGDASNTTIACTQPTGYVATQGDLCVQDPNKTAPGLCGCGNVDEDIDNDGICDLEDDDLDNDLVPSSEDCDDLNANVGRATTWYRDQDNDGSGDISQTLEACIQPNGYVASAGDQCPNDGNKLTPGTCGCGSADIDSDNDGVLDCDDVCSGSDDNADNDNDGIPDGCDNDDDNDGINDGADCDPFDASVGSGTIWYADFDGDGVGNAGQAMTACTQPANYVASAGDQCPNDGNKTQPGFCGCGTVDTDSDNDGAPNCIDQCPNDPNKLYPGTCGCGVIDVDVDNDGQCDNTDDDLDNDGVVNAEDCAPTNPSIGAPSTWYQDVDGDGFGDPTVTITTCFQPSGYVAQSGDECIQDPNKSAAGDCGCGVEEGTCLDCAGVPFGNAFYDNCQNCVSSAAESCTQDCNGDWGGDAYLDVCNVCSGGNTGRTPVSETNKCSATAVEDELDMIGARVYPNPFERGVNIEVQGEFEIVVYSITGVMVEQRSAEDVIKVGEYWPQGMYIVQILKGDNLVNVKVEKQ